MKESIRSVLKNENPGEMKMEQKYIVPEKRIEIKDNNELNDVDLQVTNLIIHSHCYNSIYTLGLFRTRSLQSIEIGDECFESVKTFKIEGLNQLKSLKIGKNSFTQVKQSNWNSDKTNNQSKSFHILNCESLKSIEIGEYSFSDFGGEFELKNLPALQSIQIGKIGSESTNFFYSLFTIHGKYIYIVSLSE